MIQNKLNNFFTNNNKIKIKNFKNIEINNFCNYFFHKKKNVNSSKNMIKFIFTYYLIYIYKFF